MRPAKRGAWLLSTLMLPSALRVGHLRELLSRKGARTRVVVGGAPLRLDSKLAGEVGADAVGTNTASRAASDQPTTRSP